MAIVKWPKTLYSLRVTQKFGDCKALPITSKGTAHRRLTVSMAGIYQRKHTRNGVEISLGKFQIPTNPRTPKQQAWRAIFRAGVLEWQALDSETKAFYNTLATPLHIEGFNLFMRRWLHERKHEI